MWNPTDRFSSRELSQSDAKLALFVHPGLEIDALACTHGSYTLCSECAVETTLKVNRDWLGSKIR